MDKLTYLRQALKDGPAQNVMEGLSQTVKNYEEAVKCLQECYDWPTLIDQAHVLATLAASPIQDSRAIQSSIHSYIHHTSSIHSLPMPPKTDFGWVLSGTVNTEK